MESHHGVPRQLVATGPCGDQTCRAGHTLSSRPHHAGNVLSSVLSLCSS